MNQAHMHRRKLESNEQTRTLVKAKNRLTAMQTFVSMAHHLLQSRQFHLQSILKIFKNVSNSRP